MTEFNLIHFCLVGTILHPQKHKKERLPLKELLSNLPRYPPNPPPSSQAIKTRPEQSDELVTQHQSHNVSAPAKVVYRNDDFLSRENRMSGVEHLQGSGHERSSAGTTSSSRRNRPVTAYDILQNNKNFYGRGNVDDSNPR